MAEARPDENNIGSGRPAAKKARRKYRESDIRTG